MEAHNCLQYFIDIGNSTVFGTPIKFTEKYSGVDHYQNILDDQERLQKLIYKMILSQQANHQQFDLTKLIGQSGFKAESHDYINQVLKIKYGQYKRQFIKKQLYQGGKHLTGFNWKIKNIMGCSHFTHKNKVIVKLQLFLKQGKKSDQSDTISLELGVSEARQFLLKLKQIIKQVKSINY